MKDGLQHSKSIQLLALVALGIVFLALRIHTAGRLLNPDENIAWAVAKSMAERGDLNANWRLADDIRQQFKYDMYNFYSYDLIARLFLKTTQSATISTLRLLNVVFQFLTLLFVWATMDRLGTGFWRALFVVFALAVLPTMVMDAHIARTESLLYFLLSLLIYLSVLDKASAFRTILFGVVLGVGGASKITFVLGGLILLPELYGQASERLAIALKSLGFVAAGFAIGFAMGAPYAILDPQVYLAGLKALSTQYSGSHLPHSSPGTGPIEWTRNLLLFCSLITGGAFLLGFTARGKQMPFLVGLTVMSATVLGYFCLKPVFFERNISLALMATVFTAFLSSRRPVAVFALCCSLLVMLYWSTYIAVYSGSRLYSERSKFEVKTFGRVVQHAWPANGRLRETREILETCRDVIGIYDFGDGTSRSLRQSMYSEPIAAWKSPFHILPTSTLHTYLDRDVYYYTCG